ncbi:MAG: response regulator transcription factor [Candidatus Saccharimonadales bacterium]
MRILVVEDEHKIANALKRGLEQESYAVDVSYNGNDGLTMATTEPYDLVILDRMLPGGYDGLDIVSAMRKGNIHTPVLLLTAKDGIRDRVKGLDAGADDYLVKPFSFDELLARVRALLRRPQEQLDVKLKYNDIVLDRADYTVTRNDVPITLTHKEFALLEFLMRNPGRVLSKDTITQHVWNYDADILPNTVEVYMGYIRNKVDKPFKGEPLIKTRRGFGYIFGKN